ncbi:MAG TPA: hypothetical protein VH141_05780 [Pseudonocardia sp.]|jgi:hypothetical protein|nr:hypothetical protein [Pseudonocardia sp.]
MRGVASLLLSIAAATLLAGCASPAKPPPPAPPPMPTFGSAAELGSAVAARQQTDRTARVTLAGELTGQPGSDFHGVGVVRLDDAGPSMQFAQQVGRGAAAPAEVNLVIVPDAAFLKPPADMPLPPRKTWLQVGPSARDPFVRGFTPMVDSLRATVQPGQLITRYGDAVSITGSAEEPLAGVQAVRYDLRVDLAKAAALGVDPVTGQPARRPATGRPAAQASQDFTLWVDHENRPLRTVVNRPNPAAPGTFTLDAQYRDWGKPVKVGPPTPDQVVVQ